MLAKLFMFWVLVGVISQAQSKVLNSCGRTVRKKNIPYYERHKRRMRIMISELIKVAVSMVKLFIGLIKLIVKVVLGAMLIDWYMDRRATRKKVN